MYKKLIVYVFIFILSISIVFSDSTEAILPEAAVNSAFTESGASLEHININSYVILNNKFVDLDNASKICNDISGKLGMKEVNIEKNEDMGFCQVVTRGVLKEGVYGTIILQSTMLEGLKESNIVIDIIETREQYELSELCGKIRKILKNYGEYSLNINLTSHYEGFMDKEVLKTKIDTIFQTIGAQKIEGIEDDSLISITGYVPGIQEYISYCGKKANMNIAVRYNSYENKTYLWIGTPLIVMEY